MTDDRGVPFEHDGATLLIEERAASIDPPPRDIAVVLIHGIGMGRTVFADLVEHLHGLHIVAVDLPGYGEAPEPPRTPTIERMADLVGAYLTLRSHERVVVLGHSMGTQVATEIAVRHPDLVDGVVLAAPTVNDRERTAVRQLLRLGQDLLVESPRVLVRGGREYLRAGPNLRRKMRAMLAHRLEDAMPRVRVPVLVVRGEHDCVAPVDWCERIVAAAPDAQLFEIAGHGHETLIRDAEPAAAAVRAFLRELS